ncbi:helix-hairpin-helix domain-containing protein [Danxiaibacter flavus]|uniref:Helix-hairpin-helix domain-containing protein n=1 Tax=Danxiaibacter flavus TaxID=3049108 RepID=A0ABV3Z9H7_9BACT|nr:helix-hairpin-helix domain-containing protein [Chitinophagaceae bacterium DXS]
MDNYAIADNFSMLSKLMDIHGENSFKSKTYSVAAFTIEKLPMQLAELPQDKIFSIKGIGESVGQKIIEQLQKGTLPILDEYVTRTPAGIIEMLNIKGIGPKKISTIWKELEVESLGELLYACNENRLTLYKGFGEKTQKNIKESIEFYLGNKGSYLYAQIESYAAAVQNKIKEAFPGSLFLPTGDIRKHTEIITKLEWVTDSPLTELQTYFEKNNFSTVTQSEEQISFTGEEHVELVFYYSPKEEIYLKQFITSCSESFLTEWAEQGLFDKNKTYNSEEEIFANAGVDYIQPYLRETAAIIAKAQQHALPAVIEPADITAIIHSHSKWSDGVNSIEEMGKEAVRLGLQYLVISDHSKTAFYANGLSEERIIAQHGEVDELNKKLAPFKIFKSIESDILNDGSLDYADEVLNTFDIVIASVHSNLKMTEEKAMMRLLKAIENPYTSILGHMTGRLLLSRNGYPVDHKKIIEACAANNVVIELNAHPRRLDIDWRWIDYALEKNVLISIDPDAHSIEGFADTKYGVLAAQKAGLTKDKNLSSYSLAEFEKFVEEQKKKRP